jgi:hypothetical protein
VTWTQRYDPLGAWPASTLVSALPVLTLFFVLLGLRRPVWQSALAGMLVAIALAVGLFHMPPALVAAAAGHGVVFGFLRIAWIIIASLFLYEVAVESGQFQVMKDSIAALSADRRLQVVLIAFCFGAFLEGTGGGGGGGGGGAPPPPPPAVGSCVWESRPGLVADSADRVSAAPAWTSTVAPCRQPPTASPDKPCAGWGLGARGLPAFALTVEQVASLVS